MQTGYEVSSLSVPVISCIYAPLIRLRRMALYKFILIDWLMIGPYAIKTTWIY